MRNYYLLVLLGILFLTFSAFSQLKAQSSWGDYTLYASMNGTKAYLIDLNGTIYHQWTFPSTKKTGYSTYLLPGGNLVRTVVNPGNVINGGGGTGCVQKVDWNGIVFWDFVYSSSTYCLHHDICPLANGNVLMISYEVKTAPQAVQAGSATSITIWSEKIMEVQPTGATSGNVVWEWHVWDHLSQNVNSTKDNYVTSISDHPELFNINYQTSKDWLHMNGIDYNVALDQITFSSHYLNEVYVIDHSTTTAEAAGHTGGNSGHGGDLLYRWGNPAAYSISATANFNVVHDAHFVPADCPKAGYIAAFNNRGGTGGKSCVDLIDPPYDGYNYYHNPGTAYAPSTYNWRHTYSGSYTQDMGNSQQLPNGNTLICIAQSGYIYEIDSNQAVVWSKSTGSTVAQAFRYTSCYVNGTAVTPLITLNGNTLSATSSASYQWYLNGVLIDGATSQSFIPVQAGNYQVQVVDNSGCTSGLSAVYAMTGAGIDNFQKLKLTITPNPSTGMISIKGLPASFQNIEIVVCDAYGKLILKTRNVDILDLSAFQNGVYFVTVKSDNDVASSKRIVLIK